MPQDPAKSAENSQNLPAQQTEMKARKEWQGEEIAYDAGIYKETITGSVGVIPAGCFGGDQGKRLLENKFAKMSIKDCDHILICHLGDASYIDNNKLAAKDFCLTVLRPFVKKVMSEGAKTSRELFEEVKKLKIRMIPGNHEINAEGGSFANNQFYRKRRAAFEYILNKAFDSFCRYFEADGLRELIRHDASDQLENHKVLSKLNSEIDLAVSGYLDIEAKQKLTLDIESGVVRGDDSVKSQKPEPEPEPEIKEPTFFQIRDCFALTVGSEEPVCIAMINSNDPLQFREKLDSLRAENFKIKILLTHESAGVLSPGKQKEDMYKYLPEEKRPSDSYESHNEAHNSELVYAINEFPTLRYAGGAHSHKDGVCSYNPEEGRPEVLLFSNNAAIDNPGVVRTNLSFDVRTAGLQVFFDFSISKKALPLWGRPGETLRLNLNGQHLATVDEESDNQEALVKIMLQQTFFLSEKLLNAVKRVDNGQDILNRYDCYKAEVLKFLCTKMHLALVRSKSSEVRRVRFVDYLKNVMSAISNVGNLSRILGEGKVRNSYLTFRQKKLEELSSSRGEALLLYTLGNLIILIAKLVVFLPLALWKNTPGLVDAESHYILSELYLAVKNKQGDAKQIIDTSISPVKELKQLLYLDGEDRSAVSRRFFPIVKTIQSMAIFQFALINHLLNTKQADRFSPPWEDFQYYNIMYFSSLVFACYNIVIFLSPLAKFRQLNLLSKALSAFLAVASMTYFSYRICDRAMNRLNHDGSMSGSMSSLVSEDYSDSSNEVLKSIPIFLTANLLRIYWADRVSEAERSKGALLAAVFFKTLEALVELVVLMVAFFYARETIDQKMLTPILNTLGLERGASKELGDSSQLLPVWILGLFGVVFKEPFVFLDTALTMRLNYSFQARMKLDCLLKPLVFLSRLLPLVFSTIVSIQCVSAFIGFAGGQSDALSTYNDYLTFFCVVLALVVNELAVSLGVMVLEERANDFLLSNAGEKLKTNTKQGGCTPALFQKCCGRPTSLGNFDPLMEGLISDSLLS